MKSRVMIGFVGLLIATLVVGDVMARGRGGGGRGGGGRVAAVGGEAWVEVWASKYGGRSMGGRSRRR